MDQQRLAKLSQEDMVCTWCMYRRLGPARPRSKEHSVSSCTEESSAQCTQLTVSFTNSISCTEEQDHFSLHFGVRIFVNYLEDLQ